MTDNVRDIKIEDFDYQLPEGRIALHPLAQRDRCKLLVWKAGKGTEDHVFSELPELLPDDSVLVYNNTRVINARLRFRKGESDEGALVEVFCLEPVNPADYAQNFASTQSCSWTCLVGNSKKWKPELALRRRLTVDGKSVTLTARRATAASPVTVTFEWDDDSLTFSDIIGAAGEIPIPPYLNRNSEESDNRDYQTVFSRIEGSVAAPTAGLHFTPALLEEIDRRGVTRREVTLHVGAGTFQPVKSEDIGHHPMHAEFIAVDRNLIEELAQWTAGHRPVIAVGTTSVRTLESLYQIGALMAAGRWDGEVPQWWPYDPAHPRLSAHEALNTILENMEGDTLVADTRLIIAPGYSYRIVDGMVTNFHQPKSTLLLLVSAFIAQAAGDGREWRRLYDHALAQEDYRFLSYGDACLLIK